MHKFRLKIELANTIIYQATFSFTEEQYQARLTRYRRSDYMGYVNSFCCYMLEVAMEKSGREESIDTDNDYSSEFPDEVIGMCVWNNVSSLFSTDHGWCNNLYPLDGKDGTLVVEEDCTHDFDWSWERIAE